MIKLSRSLELTKIVTLLFISTYKFFCLSIIKLQLCLFNIKTPEASIWATAVHKWQILYSTEGSGYFFFSWALTVGIFSQRQWSRHKISTSVFKCKINLVFVGYWADAEACTRRTLQTGGSFPKKHLCQNTVLSPTSWDPVLLFNQSGLTMPTRKLDFRKAYLAKAG